MMRLRALLRHRMTVSFYLPSLLYAFSRGLLIPILPLYAATFDISYGLIGLVLAGEPVGTLLGDVPAGVLRRRLGSKRTMWLGLSVTALLTVALFWVDSVLLAILFRVGAGLGIGLFDVARHTYLADNVFIAKRGRAIALFGGIHRVGNFSGPAVGGVVATLAGLRAPFLLYGVVAAMAVGLVVIFLQVDDGAEPALHDSPRPADGHLLDTFKAHYRILFNAGAGQLFAQLIRKGRTVIIPLYGADVLGLDAQAIGFIVSIASAIDMALFYPAGWVMDNAGRKYAIVPSFVGQAIGMALVPFSLDAGGLLFATSLMGFANGLSSGTMMTLGSDLAPQDSRSEFLGMWRLVGDSGKMGGPVVVGGIADLVTLPTAAVALAVAGLSAAAIFAYRVPETLQKRKVKAP